MASVVAAVAGALAPSAAAAATLSGVGSTLVAPVLAEWSASFQAFYGVGIDYFEAAALTAGTDVASSTVDFDASDEPLTSSQLSSCPTCLQIPWTVSALGIGYNVPGVGLTLHLTPNLLAEIYMGQIKRWNDSRIKAVNPRLHLPATKIVPINTDGSGETYVFTNYLSAANSTWRTRIGTGATVSFPAGVSEPSTSNGVSILESTTGAIEYVGVPYLLTHELPAAAIENAADNYVYPNLNNIETAADTVKSVRSIRALQIVNPPRGAHFAYPISTYTYAIVRTDATQRATLKRWILYALGEGQRFGPALDFAAIPSLVSQAAKATAGTL